MGLEEWPALNPKEAALWRAFCLAWERQPQLMQPTCWPLAESRSDRKHCKHSPNTAQTRGICGAGKVALDKPRPLQRQHRQLARKVARLAPWNDFSNNNRGND